LIWQTSRLFTTQPETGKCAPGFDPRRPLFMGRHAVFGPYHDAAFAALTYA